MIDTLPVSPLSLNQLTRDYWGQYDPAVIAQLAALAQDPCYRIKFYKAPEDDLDALAAYGYSTYGMRVKPGSLIFGIYQPFPTFSATTYYYTVQVTDVTLGHKWFDDPVTNFMLGNQKPEFQSDINSVFSAGVAGPAIQGGFPNLMCAPYPVVGSGQFDVEIQETSGQAHRIQLVFGVLEVNDVG